MSRPSDLDTAKSVVIWAAVCSVVWAVILVLVIG